VFVSGFSRRLILMGNNDRSASGGDVGGRYLARGGEACKFTYRDFLNVDKNLRLRDFLRSVAGQVVIFLADPRVVGINHNRICRMCGVGGMSSWWPEGS
jgi:hypothetical protein